MSETYHNLKSELIDSGRLFEDAEFPMTMNGYVPGSMSQEFSIKREDLRKAGTLYEDPEFLVGSAVLPKDLGDFHVKDVEWLRPKDIVDPGDKPEFIVGGVSHHDVDQGLLSDCWFLSAAACLAVSNRELFERVVPPDQDFNTGYTGMFRFNFWRDGGFQEVLVDDRLPTIKGKRIFAHNKEERNEFWPSLLEKAYAKFYGGYDKLHGGDPNDALLDLTGGLTEFKSLENYQDDMSVDKDYDGRADVPLFLMLVRMRRMSSLLCCFTKLAPSQKREEVMHNGLIAGHGYTLTGMAIVDDALLIKLRNPWGDKYEWKGQWSDESSEWNKLTKEEKELLGYKNRDDGEFWIPYQDFLKHFSGISMCHLSPKGLSDSKGRHGWNELRYNSDWVKGMSAGGSMKEKTFWENPQFAVTLDRRDDITGDGLISILVSLLQTNAREIREKRSGICYDIFRVRRGARPSTSDGKFTENDLDWVEGHPAYIVRPTSKYCECIGRHDLVPDTYVFVPSTLEPGEEGSFLLRVYTESPARGDYD